MEQRRQNVSRRDALKLLSAAGGLTIVKWSRSTFAEQLPVNQEIEPFTGPGPNPHWNSVGPSVGEPQKAPLLGLTDGRVELEKLGSYFRTESSTNAAFT